MGHKGIGIFFDACLNLIFSNLPPPISLSLSSFFASLFPSLSIIELLLWSPNVAANNRMRILYSKLFHFHFDILPLSSFQWTCVCCSVSLLFASCSSPISYFVFLFRQYQGLLIPVQRNTGNPGIPLLSTSSSPQVF